MWPSNENFLVLGMNHRTAPVALRERLALPETAVEKISRELVGLQGVQEALFLSTCNRVELYIATEAEPACRDALVEWMARAGGLTRQEVEPCLYDYRGADAVRHVFRVASSLDSMLVGEPQILGQVKDAFALAQSAESIGPLLYALLTQAILVAKRVRTETEIAKHAVSVSYAAVELARKIFGGLGGRVVFLIGAGKMGELAAKHLAAQGASRLLVANRTEDKARALADLLRAEVVPFDRLDEGLVQADVVLSSTGAPEPVIRRSQLELLLSSRRHRPLFLVDIAVPRDIEATVNDLPNVYLYDIDDLKQVVEANLRERQREALRAEGLIEREVERFLAWLRDQTVVPIIVSLRARLETIRQREVAKALSRLGETTPEARQAIEMMSAAIVNKILHLPIVKLREASRLGNGQLGPLVQELFGLGGDLADKNVKREE